MTAGWAGLSTNRKRGQPRVKDVPIYTAGSRNVPPPAAVLKIPETCYLSATL